MKVFIGIDPGKNGALAYQTDTGGCGSMVMPITELKNGDMINLAELRAFFAQWPLESIAMVALEKVHASPKFRVVGNFNLGMNYGELCMFVKQLCLPLELVTPQAWQKVIHHGMTKGDAKANSIAYVKRRFPTVSLKASPRCKIDHDGIADATCIAEWARLKMLGR